MAVGIDANIQQLIEAVKRHPGSPAYAKLAEHYLEQENLEQALRVCQEGFAVNPSYERGAAVFLSVLRRLRDPQTAGEVFSRAVAYVPRSAQLRVIWAMILAEAGRNHEARRFAREAMDLSPLNSEARALLATLGGTPGLQFGDEGEGMQAPPGRLVSGEHHESQSDALQEQAPGQKAILRPRVRPVGQRTTAHQLFDLTPGPEIVREQPSPTKDSPFDITPMPLLTESPDTIEAFVETPAPPSRPPPTPPPRMPPPTPQQVERTKTVKPLPGPSHLAGQVPVLKRRTRIWLPVLLIVLAVLGGGGFFAFRAIEDRKVRQAVNEALQLTDPDLTESYFKARDRLAQLRSEHPDDPGVMAAVALVNAHLVARFRVDASVVNLTRMIVGQLEERPDRENRKRVAHALLDLHDKKARRAFSRLQGAEQGTDSWHFALATILTMCALDKADQVRRRLDSMLQASPRSAALFYEGAVLHRRSGQLDLSGRLVRKGLELSPSHPGLRIQQALIHALEGKQIDQPEIAQLEQSATVSPGYLAAVALLKGLQAARQGQLSRAIQLGNEALRHNPDDPELGAWLGIWQLRPGGDAVLAMKLLRQYAPRMGVYDPAKILWMVQALLLSGRPHEAYSELEKIPREQLSASNRRWLEELEVLCVHQKDDQGALMRLCQHPGPWIRENPDRGVACIEALLERSKTVLASELIRTMSSTPFVRYLHGLRALTLGDASQAITLLSPLANDEQFLSLARARPLLTLARAHGQRGEAQQAIALLRRAVVLDAQSLTSRAALAGSLVTAGHDTEALSILEAIIEAEPSHPSVLSQAGQAFLSLGLPSKAQLVIQQALKFNAQSTAIRMLAGRVALANNRLPEAAAMFNMVLKKTPNSPEALVELGRIMAVKKKRKMARRYFARAVKLRPKDPELLLRLSHALALSGNYKKSLDFGLQAIELLHQSKRSQRVQEALVALGRSLKGGGRWARQRAEEILFEATKVASAPATAFLELGVIYRQNKDLNRAVWCFRQATTRDPALAEAYWELGLTLSKKKKWRKDARKALAKFLKLRPQGEKGSRAKSLLKRLK